MTITLRLNYKGPGDKPQHIQFTTRRSLDSILEAISRATSTGGLYSVTTNDRLILSIPGRRIETIEQVDP